MTENLEFYPDDFEREVVVSNEQLLTQLEYRISQSLYQQLASQRRAQAALIGAKKAKMITGDRLPSPSVAPDIYKLDSLNQNVTLDQYHELFASVISFSKQIQQWQVSVLEPPLCDDIKSECSD